MRFPVIATRTSTLLSGRAFASNVPAAGAYASSFAGLRMMSTRPANKVRFFSK